MAILSRLSYSMPTLGVTERDFEDLKIVARSMMKIVDAISTGFRRITKVANASISTFDSGTTAHRPAVGTKVVGSGYLDLTLNKPIWWNGTNWIDATGATV